MATVIEEIQRVCEKHLAESKRNQYGRVSESYFFARLIFQATLQGALAFDRFANAEELETVERNIVRLLNSMKTVENVSVYVLGEEARSREPSYDLGWSSLLEQGNRFWT